MQDILSEEQLNQLIHGSTDVVPVICGATWCGNCKNLQRQLSEHNIQYTKLDVDELSSLSDQYGVVALPTTLFFKDGTLAKKYVGSSLEKFQSTYQSFYLSNDTTKQDTNDINTGVSQLGIEPVVPVIRESDMSAFPVRVFKEVSSADGTITALMVAGGNHTSEHSAAVTNEILTKAYDLSTCSDADILSLFEYRVPTLSLDGTCSNVHQLAKRPFNLATDAYNIPFNADSLRSHPATLRLHRLHHIVDHIYEVTKADWIGIYRCVNADGVVSLMKESYRGEPSRAIFPLTEEFAAKSTNSWVGITGGYRVIENTNAREEGVAYYECSGQVQSELCVPILSRESVQGNDLVCRVMGIIDLESWNVKHFSDEMIANVLRIAESLGHWKLGV